MSGRSSARRRMESPNRCTPRARRGPRRRSGRLPDHDGIEALAWLKAQIEGEKVAARRRIRGDLGTAIDVLIAQRADLGIESVESFAIPLEQVPTEDAQARSRDP